MANWILQSEAKLTITIDAGRAALIISRTGEAMMDVKPILRVLSEPEKTMVQQVILPVIASGTDGSFRPVGSCWIFATAGRDALAFSAAHVFEEVVRSEGRHESAVASMPDVFRSLRPKAVSLAVTRLKALYRHRIDQGLVVDIQVVHRDGLTDVAVCQLTFQSDAPPDCVFERKMAIHAGPVPRGTEVAVVGYAGMEKTRSYVDEENGIAWAEHFHQLTFEHGKCVEYHNARGPRGPVGPCFEIDVSSQHGMSGGPVVHKGYGDEIVGCGVISRGTSFGGDESTMGAALWPAYSFNIDSLRAEGDQQLTLIDLAREGWIDDKSNGPAHFKLVRGPDENGGMIAWS
jgi:Trypsin-like peptidase domain